MPKDVEIKMSSLSCAEKQLCVNLLAQANLEFQANGQEFIAHLALKSNNASTKKNTIPSGKISLQKAVRLGKLQNLSYFIPFVNVYSCPKRLSLDNLIKHIEDIYEQYWLCKSNKSFAAWVCQYCFDSKSDQKLKNAPSSKKSSSKNQKENTVPNNNEKIKMEVGFLSLIESCNHFSLKNKGNKNKQ